jgi:hypothetical protein
MNFEIEIEKALRTDDPGGQLILLANRFHDEGYSKELILDKSIKYMLKLRSLGREKDEDLIYDFCDYLQGYTADKPPF